MTTKAKGRSIRQKLINLSLELGLPYQNLETAFMLERLVARLVADEALHRVPPFAFCRRDGGCLVAIQRVAFATPRSR